MAFFLDGSMLEMQIFCCRKNVVKIGNFQVTSGVTQRVFTYSSVSVSFMLVIVLWWKCWKLFIYKSRCTFFLPPNRTLKTWRMYIWNEGWTAGALGCTNFRN